MMETPAPPKFGLHSADWRGAGVALTIPDMAAMQVVTTAAAEIIVVDF
jgi:hypothetical protein